MVNAQTTIHRAERVCAAGQLRVNGHTKMGTFHQIVVAVLAAVCVSESHYYKLVEEVSDLRSNPIVVERNPPSTQMPQSAQYSYVVYSPGSNNFTIVGNEFVLNGEPLHIISGSIHYFRMPHQYWRDRIRKAKAVGFNAIATYVEWSYHEPEYRQYRFSGDYDVAQFVRIAAEEGLLVLLRPGPYICAERDLGGLPYWLLHRYPKIQLRTIDKSFIAETRTWMEKLFKHLTPFLIGNGGPIILVQVENEYGSYGYDMKYKVQVRDIIDEHVGSNALLYTTDGVYRPMLENGMVPGAVTTMDFGVDYDISIAVNRLREVMPTGPVMNSEFYPGWLTHWGERFQQVDKSAVTHTLLNLLRRRINVNFYVFYGGTNFGFSAGANYIRRYLPDITSYDYDAPLTEAGDPTPKYYAIRQAIDSLYPTSNKMELPVPSPKGKYGIITVTPQVNLLSNAGRLLLGTRHPPVTGSKLPTFEQLQQRAGLVLYETTFTITRADILQIDNIHDRVYVYVDGELQVVLSRTSQRSTAMIAAKQGSVLSLLVESQGRINYGSKLHDFKGILGEVKWGEEVFDKQWLVTGFSLEHIIDFRPMPCENTTARGPILYKGQFTLREGETPLDTFLDTTGWGKGYVWVNGQNLGRYWPVMGPQATLYVPGVWLHAAPHPNTIHILELQLKSSPELEISSIDYPILNKTDSLAVTADPQALIVNI